MKHKDTGYKWYEDPEEKEYSKAEIQSAKLLGIILFISLLIAIT
jgi:hypothetical protein